MTQKWQQTEPVFIICAVPLLVAMLAAVARRRRAARGACHRSKPQHFHQSCY